MAGINRLSDTAIRAKDLKPGRHSDGGGLYLKVSPKGNRSWVFVWVRGAGGAKVWKEIGLGAYPAKSLKDARKDAEEIRSMLARGLDPQQERKRGADEPTFGQLADEYIEEVGGEWRNQKHREQWRMTLGDAYCKSIRSKPVSSITTDHVASLLRPIWRTKPETAQRLRGRIERVLGYAKARKLRQGENPAAWKDNLEHILSARSKLSRGHHAAMPYGDVPALMDRLGKTGSMSALALRFLILTATRSGEVRGAVWSEFDLDAALWTIPADRMKMRKAHRVPLSAPALAVVSGLSEARTSEYVFPGATKDGKARALSVMALTMQMRRLGLGHFTPHGFRSAFRDWAGDETDFARELAEQALAHKVGDATEQAYRRADALARRRELMNAWAAFCTAPVHGGGE